MKNKNDIKQYPFKTIKERFKTGTGVAGGGVLLAATALTVLTPAATAVSILYGALYMKRAKPKSGRSLAEKKGYQLTAADAPVTKMAAEISAQMGLAQPPGIFVLTAEQSMKQAAPLLSEFLRKLFPKKSNEVIQHDTHRYVCTLGKDAILTTDKALTHYSPEELRFIMAHEISHLKTDTNSASTAGKSFQRGMTAALLLSAPVVLTTAAALLPGVAILISASFLTGLGMKYASRLTEMRADRNALYVTRDLDSAQSALYKFTGAEETRKKHRPFESLTRTHPCFHKRMKKLAASFNMVSQYPVLNNPPIPVKVVAEVQSLIKTK